MATSRNWMAEQLPLISLPQAGHVSPSPLPESNRDKMTSGISGRKCFALLTKQSPFFSWVKTFLVSSVWHSNVCVLTWKASALKSNRLLFRLVPSMRPTDEIEFGLLPTPRVMPGNFSRVNGKIYETSLQSMARRGLLPTPVANDDNKTPSAHLAMKARMKGGPRYTITSLQVLAKAGLLPTPRATEGKDPKGKTGNRTEEAANRAGWTLSEMAKLLPTPRAIYGEHPGMTCPSHLTGAVRLLPTVRANKWGLPDSHGSTEAWEQLAQTEMGGSLNPEFVEFMMGYPPGWTELPEDFGIETQQSPLLPKASETECPD